MNMKRFWINMNILYERLMLVAFIVALLVVCYGLYDTWYVFNKAQDDSYLNYKPRDGQGVPDDAPITEDMVAWLTSDDTNIDYHTENTLCREVYFLIAGTTNILQMSTASYMAIIWNMEICLAHWMTFWITLI